MSWLATLLMRQQSALRGLDNWQANPKRRHCRQGEGGGGFLIPNGGLAPLRRSLPGDGRRESATERDIRLLRPTGYRTAISPSSGPNRPRLWSSRRKSSRLTSPIRQCCVPTGMPHM